MTNPVALKAANEQRWASAKVLKSATFTRIARHLVDPNSKRRYLTVSAKTGVPWAFIAVIHERECSQDWTGSLAQGDRWNRVSVHVPAGRGPFRSWEEAAVDALANCAPYAAINKDWSIGGTLTKLEEYNGLGYASRGVPSPYLWAGTDQYRSGKYIRDGLYDPNAVDSQLGCAGLLLAMIALDPSISFGKSPIVGLPTTSHPPAPDFPEPLRPSLTHPSKGSIGAFIASVLSAIFNSRKN